MKPKLNPHNEKKKKNSKGKIKHSQLNQRLRHIVGIQLRVG